jgi:hypothetical protein
LFWWRRAPTTSRTRCKSPERWSTCAKRAKFDSGRSLSPLPPLRVGIPNAIREQPIEKVWITVAVEAQAFANRPRAATCHSTPAAAHRSGRSASSPAPASRNVDSVQCRSPHDDVQWLRRNPDRVRVSCSCPHQQAQPSCRQFVLRLLHSVLRNHPRRGSATAPINSQLLLPRRLIYVVNRRPVVDQATDLVERIRENLPKSPKSRRC